MGSTIGPGNISHVCHVSMSINNTLNTLFYTDTRGVGTCGTKAGCLMSVLLELYCRWWLTCCTCWHVVRVIGDITTWPLSTDHTQNILYPSQQQSPAPGHRAKEEGIHWLDGPGPWHPSFSCPCVVVWGVNETSWNYTVPNEGLESAYYSLYALNIEDEYWR